MDFDWQKYLDLNPDLREAGIIDERGAALHFINSGMKESRPYDYPDFTEPLNATIVQAYHSQSTSGIGDFLRGCIFLSRAIKDLHISFENHPISKYLKSKYTQHVPKKEIADIYQATYDRYGINYSQNEMQQMLLSSLYTCNYICSMFSDKLFKKNNDTLVYKQLEQEKVSQHSRELLQSNLIYSSCIVDKFLDLHLGNYNVIHVRLGDYEILKDLFKLPETSDLHDTAGINAVNYNRYDIDCDELIGTILELYENDKQDIVLMSDNNIFKRQCIEHFKKIGLQDTIKVIHTNSNHCSVKPGLPPFVDYKHKINDEELFNIVLDLKILSQSNNIYSYSVYPWGSGFPYAMAKIYDIPLYMERIS